MDKRPYMPARIWPQDVRPSPSLALRPLRPLCPLRQCFVAPRTDGVDRVDAVDAVDGCRSGRPESLKEAEGAHAACSLAKPQFLRDEIRQQLVSRGVEVDAIDLAALSDAYDMEV